MPGFLKLLEVCPEWDSILVLDSVCCRVFEGKRHHAFLERRARIDVLQIRQLAVAQVSYLSQDLIIGHWTTWAFPVDKGDAFLLELIVAQVCIPVHGVWFPASGGYCGQGVLGALFAASNEIVIKHFAIALCCWLGQLCNGVLVA